MTNELIILHIFFSCCIQLILVYREISFSLFYFRTATSMYLHLKLAFYLFKVGLNNETRCSRRQNFYFFQVLILMRCIQ